MQDDDVAARLQQVHERIAAACRRASRDPETVRTIAVTKGVAASRVQQVVDLGVHDLGENRVLEAAEKQAGVTGDVRWHLIGHLQTNKARRAAAMFDVVHSIDSERVASALAAHRPVDAEPLRLLIEVDFTGMTQRTGVAEGDAEQLVRLTAGLTGVQLVGLMTIAPPGPDGEAARPYFARLRRLRDQLETATGWALPELSMGMTHDFEVAVEEGATMVRVGTAIFGPRPVPA